jgi:hypothetical protein
MTYDDANVVKKLVNCSPSKGERLGSEGVEAILEAWNSPRDIKPPTTEAIEATMPAAPGTEEEHASRIWEGIVAVSPGQVSVRRWPANMMRILASSSRAAASGVTSGLFELNRTLREVRTLDISASKQVMEFCVREGKG